MKRKNKRRRRRKYNQKGNWKEIHLKKKIIYSTIFSYSKKEKKKKKEIANKIPTKVNLTRKQTEANRF